MVLGMGLQMTGELFDAAAQQGDLYFWRTCVFFSFANGMTSALLLAGLLASSLSQMPV